MIYFIAGAFCMTDDEGAEHFWLELECERGTFEVRVLPESDCYELAAARGDSLASDWCIANAEECARACESARAGLYLDPFTRVWRPKAVRAEVAA